MPIAWQTVDASAASSAVAAAVQNAPGTDMLQQTNIAAGIAGCAAQLAGSPSVSFIVLLSDGNANLCAFLFHYLHISSRHDLPAIPKSTFLFSRESGLLFSALLSRSNTRLFASYHSMSRSWRCTAIKLA